MVKKKLNSAILLLFSMLLIITLIGLKQDYDFINTNLVSNEKINNFYTSGFWNLSNISIDGSASGPGAHNWTWVINQEWFGGGNGSWSNPYKIENITTRLISIRRSIKYFTLKNCTVFDSPYLAISLLNVSNGKIIENRCFFNEYGIYLSECSNNTISGNMINCSESYGLQIYNSFNNTIFDNHLNKCGISISYSSIKKESNIIDTSNLINGKPFYFYFDEKDLGYDNFTNAGQVVLHNCNDSLISDLDLTQCSNGISLFNCHNNKIENNIFTRNSWFGITISSSTNNRIENNILTNNSWSGIGISFSTNNIIKENVFNNNLVGIDIESPGYGIKPNNNQIYGNNISNGICGLFIYGGEKNNISKNFIVNNYYAMYGDSDLNLFLNNSISHNKVGLEFIYSIFNNFSHNSILNNELGVRLISSQNNRFSQNFIANNTKTGIYLEESDDNDITENNIINNQYGVKLNGSSNNQIDYNEVYNNTLGIYLDEFYFDPHGPPIYRKCEYNTIFSNDINFNKHSGIYIRKGQWNNISSNNINYNNKNGILLENSDLNYVIENTINFNHCGINLTASDYNQVIGNSLYKNTVCIYEDNSCRDNFFEDNNCFDEVNGQWIFFLIIGCVLAITGIALLLVVIYTRKKSK